jgi:hypothetical protein
MGKEAIPRLRITAAWSTRIYPGRPAAAMALRHAGLEPLALAVHHFNGFSHQI